MSYETAYFCDACERVIEGTKVGIQVTVEVPGSASFPGRYDSKTVHFHERCASDLLQEIEDTVVDAVKVPMP